ncbi:MAG: glutathione S-transferase family protein [Roseococcus sp.]|jgi:glutathione S-transferase
MKLIGRTLSPFVRRVAATLNLYGMEWEALPLSTVTDGAEIARHNPLGRVPALVLPDGEVLVDSAAILDHLDSLAGPDALTPPAGADRRAVLRAVALGVGAAEKSVQAYYETQRRPEGLRWAESAAKLFEQARGGFAALEAMLEGGFLCLGRLTQADVTAVIALDFADKVLPALGEGRYPGLRALSARLNADQRVGGTRFVG